MSTEQNLVQKPAQRWMIRDYKVRGAASSDSEGGARLGLTVPDDENLGGLGPVVLGDPTDDTDSQIGLSLSRGGSIGTAQWLWSDSEGTVYGSNSDFYRWGHHAPTTTSNQGAVVVYSSVFRRLLVISVDNNLAAARIRISYSDRNARPQSSSDWASVLFTPTNGEFGEDHSLAACELRDGTLLLAVRAENGDFDFYRSADGGLTWSLAVEGLFLRQIARAPGGYTVPHSVSSPHDKVTPKLAASGDWVRFVMGYSFGGLLTYISSDNGSSWAYLSTLSTSTDLDSTLESVQDNDVLPFALCAVDASTGAFALISNPPASGNSNKVRMWYASREDVWDAKTVLGGPPIFATPRGYAAWCDPYFMYIWVVTGDNGTPNDGWWTYRAPRDRILDSASWQGAGEIDPDPGFSTDNNLTRDKNYGATRLTPIQLTACWAEDHAVLCAYLQDAEESTPITRKASRPFLFRIGGWSSRPWSTDPFPSQAYCEALHWAADQGDPAGEDTSSADSSWTTTISGGGTHSWSSAMYVETKGTTGTSTAYLQLRTTSGALGKQPSWTNTTGQIWAAEWCAAVGNTVVALPGSNKISAGLLFEVPDTAGGGGYGWDIYAVLGTNSVLVFDLASGSVLATLSGLDLRTAETPIFHRMRFAVAPGTSPSAPVGILQCKRDDGDAWHETAPFSIGLSTSLAITMHATRFGTLGYAAVTAGTYLSRWRELRISSENFEIDYTDLDESRFPGAPVAGRPRGLSAGSTSTDSSRLRAAWGGAGGVFGDAWTHTLDHDYPASALGLDSPQLAWRSAAGATAGQRVVFDACGAGSSSDDGSRFAHSGLALFGLENMQVGVVYSDDDAGLVNAVSTTFSTVQYTGIRVVSRFGRVMRISKPTGSWRDGDLSGRLFTVTAGAGLGQVHKVERHLVGDDGIDRLEFSLGSQFSGSSIAAGDSVSIFSSRAWLSYGSTLTPKRYMTLVFGSSGDNNWGGYWSCGSVVPGIERTWSPPLLWTHTDESNPFLTVQRARGGQSWAYRDAAPERTWTGRQQGAVAGERQFFRDAIDYLGRSGEEPCALLLNTEHDADEDRSILLARYAGAVSLDNQAYSRNAGASSQAWAVGDLAVSFTELT